MWEFLSELFKEASVFYVLSPALLSGCRKILLVIKLQSSLLDLDFNSVLRDNSRTSIRIRPDVLLKSLAYHKCG